MTVESLVDTCGGLNLVSTSFLAQLWHVYLRPVTALQLQITTPKDHYTKRLKIVKFMPMYVRIQYLLGHAWFAEVRNLSVELQSGKHRIDRCI